VPAQEEEEEGEQDMSLDVMWHLRSVHWGAWLCKCVPFELGSEAYNRSST
jgi:hypothetical protein